jgi:hypothetical protein
MKDPRIAKLIKALLKRFPGTSIITGPMPDAPGSGETWIRLLNAPDDPPTVVHDFASAVIFDLWGDEPHPALVGAVNRENTAKYYADRVPKARARRPARRRRTTASARK